MSKPAISVPRTFRLHVIFDSMKNDELKYFCDYFKFAKRFYETQFRTRIVNSLNKRASQQNGNKENISLKQFEEVFAPYLSDETIGKISPEYLENKKRMEALNKEAQLALTEEFENDFAQQIQIVSDYEQAYRDYIHFQKSLEAFEKDPFHNTLNLTNLTEDQVKEVGKTLKRVYETKIRSTSLFEKVMVCYGVNGENIWRPLDNKAVKDTFENMINGNYIFSVDDLTSNLSDPDSKVSLSFLNSISFKIVKDDYEGKHSSHHDQAFTPYRLPEKAKQMKQWTRILALGCRQYSYKHKCPKIWLQECCFVWAIRQFFYKLNQKEELTNEQKILLDNIKRDIDTTKHVSSDTIASIGNAYSIKFIVHAIDKRDGFVRIQNNLRGGFYGSSTPIYTIELGLFENHCFLFFEVPVSAFFLKNFDEIMAFGKSQGWPFEKCCSVVGKRNGGWKIDVSRAHMNTLTLFKRLKENNLLIPLMRNDEDVDLASVQSWVPEKQTDLKCISSNQMKLIAPEPKKFNANSKTHSIYFYADFETCAKDIEFNGFKTQQEFPFMVCVQSENGDEKHTFKGFDCAEQLLNYLPNRAVVYFHNLGFDGRLLMKYGVVSNIMKGSKIISQKHVWNGKKITLKDSYSMFPQALKTFPESFKKEFKGLNIQKELFPYRYYTYNKLSKSIIGTISEVGPEEFPPWSDSQKETFKTNINNIPNCLIDEDHFDMLLYCEFYCQQDVNVLRIGFNAFRQAALNKPIEMDIYELTTAPSLANEYLNKNVFFPNGSIYKYSGILQDYIMGAIYGGRCMTKQNKRWLVDDKILDDFDSCSLYPSAMARLFTVEGTPEIIPDNWIDGETHDEAHKDFLLQHAFEENQTQVSEDKFISYFICDIEIQKVGIERDYPSIVERTKTNNMNVNKTIQMRVDLIMLEDLVHFQKISYKVKRGIFWSGSRDHTIRTVIRQLFEQRAQYKREGNSIQQVMKLIMNSGYGKSIQKPIKTDLKFIKKDKLEHYLFDHYHNIEEVSFIPDSDTAIVKINKQLSTQFNNCVFGVSVLSMSKRIMNEVMCLAEDLNIPIYYQDTDSMHIEHDKLQMLSDAFKNKYHRELIGENIMGCFHNDFDELKNAYCVFHVSLGKKMYYDALENDKGEHAEHFRMKGIPSETIIKTAQKLFNGDIKQLYLYLYNGGVIDFDLTDGKTMFDMRKSSEILHKNKFNRIVKSTAPIASTEHRETQN